MIHQIENVEQMFLKLFLNYVIGMMMFLFTRFDIYQK